MHLATWKGNSKRIVKLLEQVSAKAGLNTRILHLEGDTIFGSTKKKLNLLPSDDSNSHRHDCVNFSIPKFRKGMSPAQSLSIVRGLNYLGQSACVCKAFAVPSPPKKSSKSPKKRSSPIRPSALARSRLLVMESPYADSSQWHIEQIFLNFDNHCRGRTEVKRCEAKIARYQQPLATPTFTRFEK